MVSLWPWKGDDSSPAAFEKTLSALSGKIAKASNALETTRQRGRRWKALWTLYSVFVYLLYVMIAGLVVGWQNWGSVEYTAVASAPVGILLVRYILSSYYDYRVSNQQAYLQGLQKQREETIGKLKEATKYNTTQELLEKYGGTPHKPAAKPKREKDENAQQKKQQQKRRETTGFAPPPTANIPNRRVVSEASKESHAPVAPQAQGHLADSQAFHPGPRHSQPQQPMAMSTGAEFAPNAFDEARVYERSDAGSKWYDRLMDVILGEDEASPKNRLVLICHECRLVNGQAPPGVRTLEEVGKWRCSACGAMNGVEAEATRIVRDLAEASEPPLSPAPTSPGVDELEDRGNSESSSDETIYSDEEKSTGQAEKMKNARKSGLRSAKKRENAEEAVNNSD